jgi:hypothetical protein
VLLIELHAEDYVSGSGAWDNRVTSGLLSATNGDFLNTSAAVPTQVLMSGRAAVLFNGSTLSSSYNAFGATTMYGFSDWSVEMWVASFGVQTGTQEIPVYQWGPRPGEWRRRWKKRAGWR